MRSASVWAAIAGAGIAAALTACAPPPPSMAACMNDGAEAKARIAACTFAIQQGARGDQLADAYRQRGAAYVDASDAAHALPDLNEAIRLDPNDADAYASRAAAREALGDPVAARGDYNQALSLQPTAQAYVSRSSIDVELHDYDGGIVDAARAIELNPEWANAWSARGYAYLGKNEYEVALADFASALKIDPDYMNAVDGRAAAYRQKHDYADAVAACNDAIKRDPQNTLALDCRATTYDAEGDYAAAIADYDQAIDIEPDHAWLYLSRSSVHVDAGEGAAAIADADKGLALEPGDPTALNTACWARALANTALPDALSDCQRSLAVRPHDGATLDSIAMVYFRMGRPRDAVASYSAALAADTTLTPSRFMRGVVERRLGDAAAADADIAAAKKADPAVGALFAKYGLTP